VRNAAANETASDDADESEESGDDGDDENGRGRKMPELSARNRRPGRQFNSAMGISIDAPAMSPSQTNAYDIHNTQQGAAPWESHDAYVR